jgi:hypothetical protein
LLFGEVNDLTYVNIHDCHNEIDYEMNDKIKNYVNFILKTKGIVNTCQKMRVKFYLEPTQIIGCNKSLRERINQTYTTSGNDNTNLCTYTYNELGFRGDSIHKKGFRVMSIGCSLTEGVGVNNKNTWSAQFCSHIPNSVNLNFGVSGRSNDYISRCLISYCDEIKPDLVLILYTFNHRREIYTQSEQIEPYIPGQSWGYLEETEDGRIIQKTKDELQNDNEDFINWYKNHLLITKYLENIHFNRSYRRHLECFIMIHIY